jgi:hypothetical protein
MSNSESSSDINNFMPFIIYRLEEYSDYNGKDQMYNYVPVYILSSLEEGKKIVENYSHMIDSTFIGTFTELKLHLCSDEYKEESIKLRRWWMPYTYFLCTTPILLNAPLPCLRRDHSELMYGFYN